MRMLNLNGQWMMGQAGEEKLMPTLIPGSVASTLLVQGQIDDPYLQDNEPKVLPVFEKDHAFSRHFTVDASLLSHDKVLLRCDGLDTLAELTLNGQPLGTADNMHRTWQFDAKALLQAGDNTLSILFRSPVAYLKGHPSPIGKPYTTLRKAACMFGWDWGLNLPDSGIWRDIYLEAFDDACLAGVLVRQRHEDGAVTLEVQPESECWHQGVQVTVTLTGPDGQVLGVASTSAAEQPTLTFHIDAPLLWWPSGYGDQPLYTLQTVLTRQGRELDGRTQRIGLRTLVLNRAAEGDGAMYQFVVNGVRVFFRGENLIIEDAILSHTNDARWERLIHNCLKSNLNGIRVWGGAYYPPDVFYDLCDRHGLLVYQDFMFACSFYGLPEGFLRNVERELEDNLRRFSHHPCIALLCGNNEIEGIYTIANSNTPETVALRKLFGGQEPGPEALTYIWHLYSQLFLQTIPQACAHYAPDTSYVHSSPSVGQPGLAASFLDYLSEGDMHYYLQYDGNAPRQKMRSMRSRFMTEMGFQSYPSLKTIRTFAKEGDRTPYSPVMRSHQKCFNGNETIELYMARDYVIPGDFENYVTLSQLQAGEIMRYAVEHLRRNNSYCSGMILWQLNDCWPVVSWSGIDYYGRWKALQYFTKRFFAPVLVSALDEGTSVGLWVTNETRRPYTGTLRWWLRRVNGHVIRQSQASITVPPGSSLEGLSLDFSGDLGDGDSRDTYLEYALFCGDERIGQGTVLFCLAKAFGFKMPDIRLAAQEAEDRYFIDVKTNCFTKALALDTRQGDCVFSDNWFDLSPGDTRQVTVLKADAQGISSLEQLRQDLFVTSLNHIMLGPRKDDYTNPIL